MSSINDKHVNHQKSLSMSVLEKQKTITHTNDIHFRDDTLQVKNHNNSLMEVNNNESGLIESSREEDKVQNISNISDSAFDGSNSNNVNNVHHQDRVVNISTISFEAPDNNEQHRHFYSQNEEDFSNTTNDNRVISTEYKFKPLKKKNNIYNPPKMNQNDVTTNDLRTNTSNRKNCVLYIVLITVLFLIIIPLILLVKIKMGNK